MILLSVGFCLRVVRTCRFFWSSTSFAVGCMRPWTVGCLLGSVSLSSFARSACISCVIRNVLLTSLCPSFPCYLCRVCVFRTIRSTLHVYSAGCRRSCRCEGRRICHRKYLGPPLETDTNILRRTTTFPITAKITSIVLAVLGYVDTLKPFSFFSVLICFSVRG